ncbi:MAG: RNA polymerase sigma factor [Micromonosporaceae bacterium]
MTAASRGDLASTKPAEPVTKPAEPVAGPEDWVAALTTPGPARDDALRRLHKLLLKAASHQVARMHALRAAIGSERVDEIVNQAADEAMVALLAKLPAFEGRSKFTTWAYKFAVLQAAVEVRRHAWQGREVSLDESADPPDANPSPEQCAEASDLSDAVSDAIEQALTPHQRRVVIALVVGEVPIDVLAERLGTSRNALYKTLHDARSRLRAHLTSAGYLGPATPEVTS